MSDKLPEPQLPSGQGLQPTCHCGKLMQRSNDEGHWVCPNCDPEAVPMKRIIHLSVGGGFRCGMKGIRGTDDPTRVTCKACKRQLCTRKAECSARSHFSNCKSMASAADLASLQPDQWKAGVEAAASASFSLFNVDGDVTWNLAIAAATQKIRALTRTAAQPGEGEDDYVAWCRYTYDGNGGIQTIKTCDSDAKGAFKVYTRTAAPVAAEQEDRK